MRRGLTLLELLVVISVLTLVAALLLPVLAQTREQGRRTVCLSNLRQIGKAHLLYLQDWDERLPYWYLPAPPRPAPFGPRRYWTEYLQLYLQSTALFHDPSAVWHGPTAGKLADYVLLTWGPGGRATREDPYYRWPGPPLCLTNVMRPAETIYLVDGWSTTGGVTSDGWSDDGWTEQRPLRHGRGTNAGFIDGHARWLPSRALGAVTTDGRGFFWYQYAAADR